ncbi:hypothetical protein AAJ76_3940001098 [Vairimorpha ceranae]|uniref:Uncharacterized protein n=1 Tax=Vairimorpha ceranae TaxID=40302 RepID=A0A0F9Z6P1_9MICR|nr:hypothetical protein AAJ76_3940001098 [Vairimorpha ceranae]KKO73604.1 hypothetical protein AAJ76_3940001098 [Vairimorpha ceranae]
MESLSQNPILKHFYTGIEPADAFTFNKINPAVTPVTHISLKF